MGRDLLSLITVFLFLFFFRLLVEEWFGVGIVWESFSLVMDLGWLIFFFGVLFLICLF